MGDEIMAIHELLRTVAMNGEYSGVRGPKVEDISKELQKRGIDVGRAAVTHWFNGTREPNLTVLAHLCDILGIKAIVPFANGKWGNGEWMAVDQDNLVDTLKERVGQLEAELANIQLTANQNQVGTQKQAVNPVPSDNVEVGVKEWVNPNPKIYSVGMLCQVLAAMGGSYAGNNAGLQEKITVLDDDGNRKAISNGAFYRLVQQAKELGLIEVEQDVCYRKDEDGNVTGKGKRGDKLITLVPNWQELLGSE
ncbi:hypothetical protein [Escherichia coli]|uniref:hypothetical protein n=1 Tax=Escherichia coli TaxID=562 RepID=UPI0015D4D851|nr:hypothetical protein [Escherichia coli]EER7558092.1 hypothetical protein [Escherichia coli]EKV5484752.1 hypothetical protein [Escherichia coli]HBB7045234.1 hypothetical protein [Escherichia coli]